MLAVCDAGCGNLRSVERALAQAGAQVTVTADPDVVRRADRVVVPGQGAFADCMQGLAGGLREAIVEQIGRGTPYLGICLGLQILFEESEEQGPSRGLGLLPGKVVRFQAGPGVKIPHMGWNQVRRRSGDLPVDGDYLYFVHSYYVEPAEPSIVALDCTYAGRTFCAAVQKDNLVATQFHPEKSQRAGIALLEWFLCR